MNYNNKDIFLQRATSGGTFEEYKLTMQTSSVLMSDPAGNLFMATSADASLTSSWAMMANSASNALNAVTASYAVSASYEIVFETSASHAEEADVALEASSSISASHSLQANAALVSISASYVPNLYPQQFFPSASWASASISASHALMSDNAILADEALAADTAANAISASWAPNLYPQQFLPSASWASASISASYAAQSISASWAPQPVVPTTVESASWASSSISASYAPAPTLVASASVAQTASYALNAGASAVTSASWGTKNLLVGTDFSQSFSVTLQPSQSVYVKLTVHSFLSNTGSIIFLGEYFVQHDGLTTFMQPGAIINEFNNNSAGLAIVSQIYDPGTSNGSLVFPIRLKSNAGRAFSASMTYEVRGTFNSTLVDTGVLDFGAITFSSASISGSGDTFEAYAPQDPVTSIMGSGTGFSGPWTMGHAYLGLQSEELFNYAVGSFVNNSTGNGGFGWSGSWVVSTP